MRLNGRLVGPGLLLALVILGLVGRLDAQDEQRAAAYYCDQVALWRAEAARGVIPELRNGHPDYDEIAHHCPGASQAERATERQLARN